MKVIDPKQLPMRSPILGCLVLWMALDHWHAPEWAYGALGIFIGLVAFIWIVHLVTAEHSRVNL